MAGEEATPARPEPSYLTPDEGGEAISTLPGSLLAFDEEGDGDAAPAPVEDAEETAAEAEGAEEAEAQPEEESEEEAPEPADDDDPLYEITLPGGETAEIPVSELAKGYSRNEDYKRKTAALAEERRALEAEKQAALQQLQAEREQLAQKVQEWAAVNPVGDPPDPSLLDSDPVEYMRQERAYRDKMARFEHARQEFAKAQEGRMREQQQALQKALAAEAQKLREAWPELADETKGREIRTNIVQGMQEHYGFAPDELSSIHDHRVLLTIRDALAYRALQQQTPKVRQVLKETKPRLVRPGVKQTQAQRKENAISEASKRLKKTGRKEHAAEVFEQFL